MGGTVIDTQPSRKPHSPLVAVPLFEPWMSGQGAHAVLDALCNLCETHAGLDPLLRPLAHLPVGFGAVAVVGQEVVVHAVEMTLLFVGGTIEVLANIVANLAGGIGVVGEEGGDGDAGRGGLGFGAGGLLLLWLALPLLFGSYTGLAGIMLYVEQW